MERLDDMVDGADRGWVFLCLGYDAEGIVVMSFGRKRLAEVGWEWGGAVLGSNWGVRR